MRTIQTITKKLWVTPPNAATTPAMVQAFWHRLFREHTHQAKLDWLHGFGNVIYADTYASPFIIRMYHDDSNDKRVAYLSVVSGHVEWRFGIKTGGFAQCTTVTDPELMDWLDSLFWFYTVTAEQHHHLSRIVDVQRLVSERMHTIKKKQGLWKRNPSY